MCDHDENFYHGTAYVCVFVCTCECVFHCGLLYTSSDIRRDRERFVWGERYVKTDIRERQ